jgi:hypothetical protein
MLLGIARFLSTHCHAGAATVGSTKGLIAQVAAEQRVALTPKFEAPRDGIEHPGFLQRALVKGRLSEKAGNSAYQRMLCLTHLVREESR